MEYECLSLTGIRGFRHGLEQCQGCEGSFCSCLPTLTRCRLCHDLYCLGCRDLLTCMDFCACLVCPSCISNAVLEEHGSRCRRYRSNYRFNLYPLILPELIEYITQFLWIEPGSSSTSSTEETPRLEMHPTGEDLVIGLITWQGQVGEVGETTGDISHGLSHNEG